VCSTLLNLPWPQLRGTDALPSSVNVSGSVVGVVAVAPSTDASLSHTLVVASQPACWTGAVSLLGSPLSCTGTLALSAIGAGQLLPTLTVAWPCVQYSFPPVSPPPAPPPAPSPPPPVPPAPPRPPPSPPHPPLPPPSPPLPPPTPPEAPEAPEAPLSPGASVHTVVRAGADKTLVGIVVGSIFGAFFGGLLLRYALYVIGTSAEQRAVLAAEAAERRRLKTAELRAKAAERRAAAAARRAAALAAGEDVPEKKKARVRPALPKAGMGAPSTRRLPPRTKTKALPKIPQNDDAV